MKRTAILGLALAGLVALAPAAQAQDKGDASRVQGSEHVKPGADMEMVFSALMKVAYSQAEIDLYLGSLDAIGKWVAVEENGKAWQAVDDADDPIAAIVALGVWKAEGVDIEAGEFTTIFLKLMMARDVVGMRAEKAELENLLKDPEVSAEEKKELKEALEYLGEWEKEMAGYPADNVALYEKNADKVDAGIERVEEWSDPGDEGEGPDEEMMEEPAEPEGSGK